VVRIVELPSRTHIFDMGRGGWFLGICLFAVSCSSGGGGQTGATGVGGAVAAPTGVGGSPSQATDTNPANPNVTNMPPASPNGPTVTIPPGGPGAGGTTGAGTGGAAGASSTGAAGDTGTGTTGAAGAIGSAGTTGAAGVNGATGAAGDTGVGGTTGAAGAGGTQPVQKSWPTVDCVGGPCATPNVCVNLDFLFVACVACGGNDQVCCPPYELVDPFLGTCDAGLVCAHNPNFQSDPPTDVVQNVCQIPGMPPAADGGLNHQRLMLSQ